MFNINDAELNETELFSINQLCRCLNIDDFFLQTGIPNILCILKRARLIQFYEEEFIEQKLRK